ncbi:hypothetical protein CONLIGDRAFT_4178 [Coniochaeta ligniaria NRRL 30616]|uniref:Uncharacterized protein n=1 Tax=Coniochaeta ligniaria NRRL 30616 TaxID=1408157 RepID=A0A1J7JYA4_9PEZI|nr:hypothetical protein CONLIGDRAFT_4178 [Coniochaeta ligniaria NRRL 30616]
MPTSFSRVPGQSALTGTREFSLLSTYTLYDDEMHGRCWSLGAVRRDPHGCGSRRRIRTALASPTQPTIPTRKDGDAVLVRIPASWQRSDARELGGSIDSIRPPSDHKLFGGLQGELDKTVLYSGGSRQQGAQEADRPPRNMRFWHRKQRGNPHVAQTAVCNTPTRRIAWKLAIWHICG